MKARLIGGVAGVLLIAGLLGLPHFSPASRPSGSVEAAPTPHALRQAGLASFYDKPQQTASGERYDPAELTAAHKTLPLGSLVTVKNLDSGKTVSVRVNDRGPYAKGRVIDLSKKAADTIGIGDKGVARVELQVGER